MLSIGTAMADGLESFEGLPADALRRAVGRDQLRVFELELLKFNEEPVELPIADLGRGLDVVEVVVALDLATQLGDALGDGHGSPH